MIILRPYQQEILLKVISAVQNGITSILVVMPCRSGKTPLAAKFVEIVSRKNKRVMFNVHRSILIDQTSKLFANNDIIHGITSPFYPKTDHNIQIGSYATVYKRRNDLPKQDLILSDEAHRDMGQTRKHLHDKIFRDSIRIGFTATPYRLSGEPLSDIYQIIIQGPSVHDLIQQGYLCDFKTFCPPSLVDTSGIVTTAGDFNKTQLNKATNKKHIIGDAIQHYKSICPNSQMVVFCCSIDHAKAVSEEYNNEGIPAGVIHSNLSDKEIKGIISDFQSKILRVLTNVDMVTEGFDCPGIETVQMLRKTMSKALDVQMRTRGMTPDKNNPNKISIILDHVNNTMMHGSVDDDYDFNFERPPEDYEKEIDPDEELTKLNRVKICGKCFHVYKAFLTRCPDCGFEKLRPYQPFKTININLQIYKSLNKKIRDLVGSNEIQGVGIETLKNRLSLLQQNEIPDTHKEFIKIQKRIELLRAKSIPDICAFAIKYGLDKYWVIRRYSMLNRYIDNREIRKLVDKYLEKC